MSVKLRWDKLRVSLGTCTTAYGKIGSWFIDRYESGHCILYNVKHSLNLKFKTIKAAKEVAQFIEDRIVHK